VLSLPILSEGTGATGDASQRDARIEIVANAIDRGHNAVSHSG